MFKFGRRSIFLMNKCPCLVTYWQMKDREEMTAIGIVPAQTHEIAEG